VAERCGHRSGIGDAISNGNRSAQAGTLAGLERSSSVRHDVTVHRSGHALAVQRDGVRSVFEMVRRVQIGNEPTLNRSPSQPFLCLRAGSRPVHPKEESDLAKMIGCFLARLADDRQVQVSADGLSDLSSRYALGGYTVLACSS
jgi:hypothetical protein